MDQKELIDKITQEVVARLVCKAAGGAASGTGRLRARRQPMRCCRRSSRGSSIIRF